MARDATTVSISLPDAAATRALGSKLAGACGPGVVILLSGPLGAGKTTLVDGFAAALGASQATSPTFVIAHSYTGRIPIWHVDLYRIDDAASIADLDLAQYMSDNAITLCEWPERAADVWPQDCVKIELAIEGRGRRATIAGRGTRSRELLRNLRSAGISVTA